MLRVLAVRDYVIAERAELSAEFEVQAGSPLAAWIAQAGLEGDPGSLILRRAIDAAGRSRLRSASAPTRRSSARGRSAPR